MTLLDSRIRREQHSSGDSSLAVDSHSYSKQSHSTKSLLITGRVVLGRLFRQSRTSDGDAIIDGTFCCTVRSPGFVSNMSHSGNNPPQPPLVIDLCESSDDDDAPAKQASSGNNPKRRETGESNNEHDAPQDWGRKRQKTTAEEVDVSALVFLRTAGGDDCLVTDDMYDALAMASQMNAATIRTCCRRDVLTPGVAAPIAKKQNLTLLHIGQKDKWSCGYRNLQMLLAALVPTLPPNHEYLNRNASNFQCERQQVLCFEIPSQPELEDTLEASWQAGFDSSGAAHYNGRVCGKRKWIGAVEVWSTLVSTGVDACVVQFIRCAESRRLLGHFCAAYFASSASPSDCPFCSLRSSQSLVRMLMETASSSTNPVQRSSHSCSCPRLPLYLQWEGHSVTIVGVESKNDGGDPVNLLLMDPVKSGSRLQSSLRRGEVQPARLGLHGLRMKDCQIILASRSVLPATVFDEWKSGINAITAAEAAVLERSRAGGR